MQVVLCERGIKTFETEMRNTIDLAAVALARDLSHLPVIADPSHGTGKQSLIAAVSRAAVAVGADGLIIEVHPCPERALSDGPQSLDFAGFGKVMRVAGRTAAAYSAVRPRTAPAARKRRFYLQEADGLATCEFALNAVALGGGCFTLHRGIAEQDVRFANVGVADLRFRLEDGIAQAWRP